MPPVHYRTIISDSRRWDRFAFREGDILISTSPKCGTTWTQMICALLVLQTPVFSQPLDLLSPWLEQLLRPLPEVVADLESQSHRRFIKSHTPLDGLPWDPRVTYITVARDPRDVVLSLDNHLSNLDFEAVMVLLNRAAGPSDIDNSLPIQPREPPACERERIHGWIEDRTPVTETSVSLSANLHHLGTFFERRDEPNVVLLHYTDLKMDLEGEMRALAARLSIDVDEALWPSLVHAATFESMKQRARDTGPNQTECVWVDRDRFFHRGRQGEWRSRFDPELLRRYHERAAGIASPDLLAWLHREGSPLPAVTNEPGRDA